MKRQSGFTLVELIAVMVILGILAAVALPRFTNMQRDARLAKLRALEGAMQGAVAMIHGTALVRAGQGVVNGCTLNAAGTGRIAVAGTNATCSGDTGIEVTNFYPANDFDGIVAAALTTSAQPPTAASLLSQGYAYDAANGIMVLGGPGTNAAGTTNTTCRIPYTPASTPGGVAAVGTAITTGC